MIEQTIFDDFLMGWILLAVLLLPLQLKITAPYGRHSNSNWGPMMDNRFGWILMEIVSIIVFTWCFWGKDMERNAPLIIIFLLWFLHYFHRSLIYPFRTKTIGKKIPMLIVLFAIIFNSINAFTNGYYLSHFSNYTMEWLFDLKFIIGIILFCIGAFINFQSDQILLKLRSPGEKGYKIPKGGLFKFVSCPNHFGEMLEWTGFAILCWNLPALAFAVWTISNLVPRAISHHKWYNEHFEDYPKDRKAVFPFLF